MTLDEVKKYFGNSCYGFSKKTGMNHANYSNWEARGFIPIKTQLRLELLTNGALKADLKDVKWSIKK